MPKRKVVVPGRAGKTCGESKKGWAADRKAVAARINFEKLLLLPSSSTPSYLSLVSMHHEVMCRREIAYYTATGLLRYPCREQTRDTLGDRHRRERIGQS